MQTAMQICLNILKKRVYTSEMSEEMKRGAWVGGATHLRDNEGLEHLHLEYEVLYGVSEDAWKRLLKQGEYDVSFMTRAVVQPAFQYGAPIQGGTWHVHHT